jgi:hypothetical protein
MQRLLDELEALGTRCFDFVVVSDDLTVARRCDVRPLIFQFGRAHNMLTGIAGREGGKRVGA